MERVGGQKKQGSIVELLRDEILSGRIPCNTELTQNELADSLGVSRMPVREALLILEYQGLIERLPNNHTKVADFTEEYFQTMFRLCGQLELEALKAWAEAKGRPKGGTEQEEPGAGQPPLPDQELLFHRSLRNWVDHSFLGKTLETMIEIYVVFGLECSAYDKNQGKRLLKEASAAAAGGSSSEARELLERYFEALSEGIMKERMR